MPDNTDSEAVKYRRFRFISMVLLVAASLSWVFYTVHYCLMHQEPNLDLLELNLSSTIPIVIVTIIAWFAPRAGGILALFWTLILLVCASLSLSILLNYGLSYGWVVLPQIIFLATGGILSINYGNWRRKNKGNK